MVQPSGQSAWIVLPCILFSLFVARFPTKDFASSDECGLMVLAKAVFIFFTTLILATKAANILFHPAPPPTQPPTRSLLRKKRKMSPASEERVRSWSENTAPDLRWTSDSSDEVKEKVKKHRRAEKKMGRRKRESDAKKLLRKSLSGMFKPKRYEMLGPRRETVEEVIWEDPLG
ncbi:hypothetical protein G6011_02374 [Alternaria panax]|uniref:Uncharacterized protein n=1 Tax=Alternaria panax TaxID=48097 RepID=A0AAD4FF15_9PLEO|nr:hypothetical protein G6011_02374 [Alternaria panax]